MNTDEITHLPRVPTVLARIATRVNLDSARSLVANAFLITKRDIYSHLLGAFSRKSTFNLVLVATIFLLFRSTSLAVEEKDFLNPPNYPNGSAFGLIKYKIYAPQPFDPTKLYPLVVFLHGAGERGNDNTSQFKNRAFGALVLAEQPFPNQAFMMMPQTTNAWNIPSRYTTIVNEIDRLNTQALLGTLKPDGSLSQSPNPWKGRIDTNRLYVTGFSLGGEGTCFFLSQSATRFAAGIPVAPTFSKDSVAAWPDWAPNVARVPTWVVSSTTDTTARNDRTSTFIGEVRAAGGNPIFSEIDGLQHTQVPTNAYPQQKLINWLFAQRKGTAPQVTPFVAITDPVGTQVYNAGAQNTFTLKSVVDPEVIKIDPNASVFGVNQTADREERPSIRGNPEWYSTVDLIPGDNLIAILARARGLFSIPNPNSISFSDTITVRRTGTGWLFDFGSNILRTGSFWNNVISIDAGTTVSNAINSDGASTSVSLTIEGAFTGVDTSGVDSSYAYPSTAQRDSFSVQGWETGMIRIKGLTPSALYNVRFFASAPEGDRMTRYRIENVAVRLDASQNTFRTAILPKVPATAQGELLVRVTTDDGAGFGHIGVLELTVSDP
jgi:predicted esterase